MFRNYFAVAFRSLVKNKLYSFINIGGLSIGIGACMLILLFVAHEHSYDKFHKNADRIYSSYTKVRIGDDSMQLPVMSYPTGPSVLKTDPSVESFLRVQESYQKKTVEDPASPKVKFAETGFSFADSNFFSFFSFRLKEGNPALVLARPFSVVISEEMAKKYFGNRDPVGKLLKYDSAYTFEITGVYTDPPSNSSIRYGFVASLSSLLSMKQGPEILKEEGVAFGSFITYFRLRPGAQPVAVQNSILKLSHQGKQADWAPATYYLTLLTNTHLGMNFDDDENIKYLTLFPLVAGLILLLALINYMSLATARATLRAKEVGVRKASGASRWKIAQQFYLESAIYTFLAFAGGYLLFRLAQPAFFHLIQLTIDPSFIYQPVVLLSFSGLLVVTILIAGTYPSLVLSSYKPVAVLYGKMSKQKGGLAIRKSLTILQFSISITLIICSLFMGRQLDFFRHTATGVNRENVLMVSFAHTIGDHYQAFKRDVGGLYGIKQVGTAHYALYMAYDMDEANLEGKKAKISIIHMSVDEPLISLLQLQWKNKPLSASVYSDDHQVIVNEAAVSKLNLYPNPLGKQIMISNKKYAVAGVVKDFVYNSLHSKIGPLCLFVQKEGSVNWGASVNGCLYARIRPGTNLPTLIEKVKNIYDRYDSNTPFEYLFMDDAFNDRYKAEDRLAGIMGMFTGLIVLIACLGLFGLASFTATQKTKEIGIRKVLGASLQSLVLLLTKDFVLPVLASILVAVPVAWWLMHKWLNNFAYKTKLGWEVFFLSSAAALIIAILTVSFESFGSARTNPAKSLRSE
ncbi:MAG TPA: ABC transporter permease [Puia sp.]|nr:ABC transporter permease [Puia sp.]